MTSMGIKNPMNAGMGPILMASRDPGSANMLVGLHWLLHKSQNGTLREKFLQILNVDQNAILRINAWGPAVKVWEHYGWAAHDVGEVETDQDQEFAWACQLVAVCAPSVLVTGLDDVDAIRTRALWMAATQQGVRVVVLADNDTYLLERCFDLDRRRFEPDIIVVSNERVREGFELENFPMKNVHVLPNLAHERIKADGEGFNDLRSEWGATTDQTLVLFVSLVGAEMIEKGRKPPFDETQMLYDLLASLEKKRLSLPAGPHVSKPFLVVRPHPRENISKFEWMKSAEFTFPVIVSSQGSPKDAIYSSDWVVGRKSGVVDEAILREAQVYLLGD
ncbi:hypothetical protein [Thalassospira lucentensis]|uniref:hypothetical protein n=1 Tax=Thalassospira lucentensis TaxID=168935 RepID=UPI0003B47E6C|nr:hypothetical protein [Thalassospira lucentensis]RCK30571.1 hypothetical protein TH1_01195 [Thalassospira lucentensis MCCC 1A00383 = DSM 14000]